MNEVEQQISELEDSWFENIQSEMEEKLHKAKKTIRESSGTTERSNIRVWKEKQKCGMYPFKLLKKFPNIGNVRGNQTQERQRTPNRSDKKQPSPWLIYLLLIRDPSLPKIHRSWKWKVEKGYFMLMKRQRNKLI